MNLKNTKAEFYCPSETQLDTAFKRTTHLAISAHQDDVEIMAYDGILKCFGKNDKWFTAVVVTNGAGSARNGLYKNYTDEQMCHIRNFEQKKAACVGEYSALALLNYESSDVKNPLNKDIIEDIKAIIIEARPQVVYTHNLADKHDTHLGTTVKVIEALRELPEEVLPQNLYGCEVWRGLDWLNDEDKIVFDVSEHPNIASSVLGVFDSQICGGKRYDLAAIGRRLANATFLASHETDNATQVTYAIDLMPLVKDKKMDICEYIMEYLDRFKADVSSRINKLIPFSN